MEEKDKPQELKEKVTEKAKGAAADITGTKDPAREIPEKGASFTEEVAEYVGRLYGSAKDLVNKGVGAIGEKSKATKDPKSEEGGEQAKDAANAISEEQTSKEPETTAKQIAEDDGKVANVAPDGN